MLYVPRSAPVGMPVRVFLGTAGWWKPLLAPGISIAATVGLLALGPRTWANGLIRVGSRIDAG